LHALHEILGPIENFRVSLEDTGCLDGQRAIDVDRNRRNLSRQCKRMEIVDDFLYSTDGECRNEDAPASRRGFGDNVRKCLARQLVRRMIPIAIGGFHDHDVGGLRWLRVPNDRKATPPDVAREHETLPVSPFLDVQDDGRRPENVPGVDEGHANAGRNLERLVVWNASHEVRSTRCIDHGIQRGNGTLAMPHQKLGVLLLDMGGVGKHHDGEITRRGGTPHRSTIALSHQQWNASRVIDVRVREYDGVNARYVDGQTEVFCLRLLPPPLEKTTIQQDVSSVHVHDVAGPGDLPRSAGERDLHAPLGSSGRSVCHHHTTL
jgi:hypothetical protein